MVTYKRLPGFLTCINPRMIRPSSPDFNPLELLSSVKCCLKGVEALPRHLCKSDNSPCGGLCAWISVCHILSLHLKLVQGSSSTSDYCHVQSKWRNLKIPAYCFQSTLFTTLASQAAPLRCRSNRNVASGEVALYGLEAQSIKKKQLKADE